MTTVCQYNDYSELLKKVDGEVYAFLEGMNKGNLVYTPWCKDSDCEDKVKEKVKEIAEKSEAQDTVGTCKTLNMPLKQEKLNEDDKCFFCGKKAQTWAIWGRSY